MRYIFIKHTHIIILSVCLQQVRDDMAKSGVEPYEDTISPRYLKGRSNCTSQDPF